MKRIAITCGLSFNQRYALHVGYSDAISRLGAMPLVVASASAVSALSADSDVSLDALAKEVIGNMDALVVSGGWDVDPSFYGRAPAPKLGATEPVRDFFEAALIRESLSQGKKVLAVCRGMQILNACLGGTLIQDLVTAGFDEHSDDGREYQVSHSVEFQPASLLCSLMEGETGVNSLHHQGIEEIGQGLRAVAYAPDGVIEALEGDGVIGVQWHPERLFEANERHLAGFKWLVE